MINPINNAAARLTRFLITLTFHPKNLTSTGRVRNPVIIRVVIKTAITEYATPLSISIPQRGYAINPGINATDPISEAVTQPLIPDPSPIYLINVSFGIRNKAILTSAIIKIKIGRSFRNIVSPFLIPFHVLLGLAIREKIKHPPVKKMSSFTAAIY
jgi:hypothetical protein